MRKLLLLFMGVLASVGSWAGTKVTTYTENGMSVLKVEKVSEGYDSESDPMVYLAANAETIKAEGYDKLVVVTDESSGFTGVKATGIPHLDLRGWTGRYGSVTLSDDGAHVKSVLTYSGKPTVENNYDKEDVVLISIVTDNGGNITDINASVKGSATDASLSTALNAYDVAVTNLTVTGTLSEANAANLTNITNAVDLSAATLAGGVAGINTTAKYLRLPNDMTAASDVTLMSQMKNGGKNPNLLVVGSSNETFTEVALHSFTSNNVHNFIDAVFGGIKNFVTSPGDTKDMVRMSGALGEYDLTGRADNNSGLPFKVVKSFDFTGATFDPYTIASMTTTSEYTDPTHPYARGTGNNDANDPFADYDVRSTMTLTNYETNAMYFISSYGTNLESIVFPTGNDEVPPKTFNYCSHLTEVNIPSHYTKIGHEAFLGCSFTTVTIGKGIKTIEAGAFSGCPKLTDVNFEVGITDQVYGPGVFSQASSLKHIVLPEGMKNLGADMFNNSHEVESVRLPSSLETIGSGCFMNCHSLSSITIPENVTKIGQRAFSLSALMDVYLTCTDPASLPLIWSCGPVAFNGDLRSTFGINTMLANGSTGQMTAEKAKTMDWDDAVLDYYANANRIAVLHYPTQLAEAVCESLSKQYNWTSKDGFGLPQRDNYELRAETLAAMGKNVGTKSDNAGVGVYTQDGWAQFALMKAYKSDNTGEVYTGLYDDVWYTMCFPFDLTDEQLATAFNENFNIADFSGVEIKKEDATSDDLTLILHFNTVAETIYKDQDGVAYVKGAKDAEGYNTYTLNGESYTHVNIADAKVKVFAKNGDKDNGLKYIDGYLAQAGHPYMVHPNTGTAFGSPKVRCYFSGISFVAENECADLYASEARTVDLNVDKTTDNFNHHANGAKYAGQTYTFKGNYSLVSAAGQAWIEENPEPTFTETLPVKRTKPETAPTAPEGEEVTTAPTEVANPAEDTDTYSAAFQAMYNVNVNVWVTSENGMVQGKFGDILTKYDFENGFKGGTGNYDWNGAPAEVKTYFNGTSISMEAYTAARTLALRYKEALDAYNGYDVQLALYQAWEAYRQALADYNSWDQAAADAEYKAAMEAYEAAYNAYVSQHEAWETQKSQYNVLIPKNAYFLGRESMDKYPKYYREIADDKVARTTGLWTQYTCIIMPNDDAVAGIEATIDAQKAAKSGFNAVFDEDWGELVSPTAIEEIIAEAEAEGQEVKRMNVVVSINGQVVRTGSTSLEGLPKGIYIVNGKKYFVR